MSILWSRDQAFWLDSTRVQFRLKDLGFGLQANVFAQDEDQTKTWFNGKDMENVHILLYSKAQCAVLDIVQGSFLVCKASCSVNMPAKNSVSTVDIMLA